MTKEMPWNYSLLVWDSEKFGYPVARIEAAPKDNTELESLFKNIRADGVKLAYWFVSPDDARTNSLALSEGGILVDEKVTFVMNVLPLNYSPNLNIKSVFKSALTPELRSLALEAGVFSRFKIDSGFKNKEFEKLYSEWIVKSLEGDTAQEVLVYESEGKVIGFVTLGVKNARANIGLIAVDPACRVGGIGKQLVEAGLNWAREHDFKEMDVVTQKKNVAACAFYEKCGFREESMVNIYHIWFQ